MASRRSSRLSTWVSTTASESATQPKRARLEETGVTDRDQGGQARGRTAQRGRQQARRVADRSRTADQSATQQPGSQRQPQLSHQPTVVQSNRQGESEGGEGDVNSVLSYDGQGVASEWVEKGDQARRFTGSREPASTSESESDSSTDESSEEDSSQSDLEASNTDSSLSDRGSKRKVARLISGLAKSLKKHKKRHRSRSLRRAYARQEKLGTTASVHVKRSLKKRVWKQEFVELEKFLPRNTRQSLQGSKEKKEKAHISSISMWQNAFFVFSDILLEKRPDLARELVAYQLNIWQLFRQEYGLVWKEYDIEFRLTLPHRPSLSWCVIDQVILGKARFEAREAQRPFRKQGDFSKSPTPNSNICFAYNRGSCTRQNCKYSHTCTHCGGSHPGSACRSTRKQRVGGPGGAQGDSHSHNVISGK